MKHYWWGGPNDGGEVETRDCYGLVVAVPTFPVAAYIITDEIHSVSFNREHWRCVLFKDDLEIKHFLVPPGFVPPPSYTKIRDELKALTYYISRPDNSGLI